MTLLARHARGLPSRRLAELLDCSRPTVDRDLNLLRHRVGLPIERVRVNGEVWHRWGGIPLHIVLTPAQRAALALARDALLPLAGTAAAQELEMLAPTEGGSGWVRFRSQGGQKATVLGVVDAAISDGHRVRIDVRLASRDGQRQRYVIEPIGVRVVRGQAYVDAWSVDKDALRTFKLARIERAVALNEPASPHPDIELEEIFAHAVTTWSGELFDVRVRVAAEVAWLLTEYPLTLDQEIHEEADGSAIVRARVAGLVEASRWVLGWGKHAEALAPASFRDLVRSELTQAVAHYEVRSPIMSEPGTAPPAAPALRTARWGSGKAGQR